jgi:hypothetical protein
MLDVKGKRGREFFYKKKGWVEQSSRRLKLVSNKG